MQFEARVATPVSNHCRTLAGHHYNGNPVVSLGYVKLNDPRRKPLAHPRLQKV